MGKIYFLFSFFLLILLNDMGVVKDVKLNLLW